jgi:hypothetical protein
MKSENNLQVNSSPVLPRTRTFLIAVLAGLLVPVLAPAQTGNPNPGVLPPNSAPQGLTYGEWSAKWLKWAYEPPPAASPVLDTTGANCSTGQSGHVWFLAGTFFLAPPAPPAVFRTCTIPTGQMLFFPIGNAFCGGDGFPGGFADERACATASAEGLSGFRAEVDGVPVNNLSGDLVQNYYRALSPKFDLVLGADNIFGAPAGTYSPSAADGVYLMLSPLSPGKHTIHFRADLMGGGRVEATYFLTVNK